MTAKIIAAAALVLAGFGAQASPTPAHSTKADPVFEARAQFIKKCFRDRTKQSCEAPPAARVSSQS